MRATFITTTPRSSVEALRYQGISVSENHAQLQSMLRRNLSPEHALLFAKGRIQALLGMMMQWPVFHSNEFTHLEKPAVRNIERLVLKWKQVQTDLEHRSLCEKP